MQADLFAPVTMELIKARQRIAKCCIAANGASLRTFLLLGRFNNITMHMVTLDLERDLGELKRSA